MARKKAPLTPTPDTLVDSLDGTTINQPNREADRSLPATREARVRDPGVLGNPPKTNVATSRLPDDEPPPVNTRPPFQNEAHWTSLTGRPNRPTV